MQNAIVRINELQDEMKRQAHSIEGAEEYIQKQMKLFNESKDMRDKLNAIEKEAQKAAESFLSNNTHAIELAKKHLDSSFYKKSED